MVQDVQIKVEGYLMKTKVESLASRLLQNSESTVRAAVDLWETYISNRRAAFMAWLDEQGWSETDAPSDAVAMPDGREIMRLDGQAYILPIEIHRARVAEAMAAVKKQREEQKQSPGEGLAAVLCPVCRSTMAKSPICPSCAKGRAGFKILCTCTECSHEVYL